MPCIIGEDMYDALKNGAGPAGGRDRQGGNQTDIGNAIFDMEALIVANCLFVGGAEPARRTSRAPDQFGAPNIRCRGTPRRR